jgi:hypothetical protein
VNTELIEQNVQRLLGAMSGAATTAMVAVGDQLGLYRALARQRAGQAGLGERIRFDALDATSYPADGYAANLASPMAALSYAASTFQCTPAALAQPGGVALGAQAGPAVVRQLAQDAGFSRFREVTSTPVNVVLELRP